MRYEMSRERIIRLISSCEPMNHDTYRSGAWRTTGRNCNPARHSKWLPTSFRMPRPEWTCGLPKTWQNSSSASKASARSALCNFSSWPMSSAVSSNDFFKFLDRWIFDRQRLASINLFFEFRLSPFFESFHFLPGDSIFRQQIAVVDRNMRGEIGRPHLDRSQGDNGSSGDNSDLFAARRGGEPFTEVLPSLSNRERLHMNFIAAISGLCQDS